MVTLSTLQALHSHTATLLSGTSYPELSLQSRTLNLCLRSFFGVEHQESCIYQHPPKAHCSFPLELSTLEKLGGSGPSMRWWVVGSGQVCCAVVSRTHIFAVITACSCYYPDQCLHMCICLCMCSYVCEHLRACVFMCMSMCVKARGQFQVSSITPHLTFWDSIFHWTWCSKIQPDWLPASPRDPPIWESCTTITGMHHCAWFLKWV